MSQPPAFAGAPTVVPLPFKLGSLDGLSERLNTSPAKYIDAFFKNANWDEVNRRLDRALQASRALRGV